MNPISYLPDIWGTQLIVVTVTSVTILAIRTDCLCLLHLGTHLKSDPFSSIMVP